MGRQRRKLPIALSGRRDGSLAQKSTPARGGVKPVRWGVPGSRVAIFRSSVGAIQAGELAGGDFDSQSKRTIATLYSLLKPIPTALFQRFSIAKKTSTASNRLVLCHVPCAALQLQLANGKHIRSSSCGGCRLGTGLPRLPCRRWTHQHRLRHAGHKIGNQQESVSPDLPIWQQLANRLGIGERMRPAGSRATLIGTKAISSSSPSSRYSVVTVFPSTVTVGFSVVTGSKMTTVLRPLASGMGTEWSRSRKSIRPGTGMGIPACWARGRTSEGLQVASAMSSVLPTSQPSLAW